VFVHEIGVAGWMEVKAVEVLEMVEIVPAGILFVLSKSGQHLARYVRVPCRIA
jgi:hypothetical protein